MSLEKLQESSGLFACVASGEWPSRLPIADLITLGLTGLQHRGHDSAGIVISTGTDKDQPLQHHRGLGLVSQVFSVDNLPPLAGNLGIGHVSCASKASVQGCQPFIVETNHGQFAVSHNGELVNSRQLKTEVLKKGVGLSTCSDSEIITQLLCNPLNSEESASINWPGRIRKLMEATLTSYALLILHHDRVYAVRDPYGNRPLCLGVMRGAIGHESHSDSMNSNEVIRGYVATSESCVLVSLGAQFYREVLPGEIVEVTNMGFRSAGLVYRPRGDPSALCLFEYVYFSRPDSFLEGQQVYSVRRRSGRELAKECPAKADIVSTIPHSSTPAAMGYAHYARLAYVEVLCKNRYASMSFQASPNLRQLGVAKTFGVLADNFVGKRIVLVDDSIIRGDTVGSIVRMLKEYGAREVHLRIASPPIRHQCYMGINIPRGDELVANQMSPQQLARHVGADSLMYLSVDGLQRAVGKGIAHKEVRNLGHCSACLTGKYPVPVDF